MDTLQLDCTVLSMKGGTAYVILTYDRPYSDMELLVTSCFPRNS